MLLRRWDTGAVADCLALSSPADRGQECHGSRNTYRGPSALTLQNASVRRSPRRVHSQKSKQFPGMRRRSTGDAVAKRAKPTGRNRGTPRAQVRPALGAPRHARRRAAPTKGPHKNQTHPREVEKPIGGRASMVLRVIFLRKSTTTKPTGTQKKRRSGTTDQRPARLESARFQEQASRCTHVRQDTD